MGMEDGGGGRGECESGVVRDCGWEAYISPHKMTPHDNRSFHCHLHYKVDDLLATCDVTVMSHVGDVRRSSVVRHEQIVVRVYVCG